ncbi:MAG TPA: ABC transporter permease [Pyrinomonadaceae bacterium]|nr:ABC transporter permease [Pyrinomonadaceae bacterium]
MSEAFSFTFVIILIFSTLRLATPLILAALGGLFSERSGVINIALEGLMLAGAFTAAVVTYEYKNPYLGLGAAFLSGAVVAGVFAIAVIKFEADQVVTGFAISLMMLGLPAVISSRLYDAAGATNQIEKEFLLPEIFTGVPLLSVVAILIVPLLWFVVYKTRFGLRLRAVGENPEAADAAGISVNLYRYAGVIISGILAAAGGAYLSIGQGSFFTKGMSAGRGYIALAALILAKWRPIPVLLSCLFFGFTESLAIQLQGVVRMPSGEEVPVQFIQMIPYILTIIVLAGFIGDSRAPKALGIPYTKGK